MEKGRIEWTDKEFLESRGWEHWYTDDNWWVHTKTVADPTRQDFTNYQFPTADAIEFEKNGKPIPYMGDIGAALKTYVEIQRKHEPKECQSGTDSDCEHPGCPQKRDGEPNKTGRSCPLYDWKGDDRRF